MDYARLVSELLESSGWSEETLARKAGVSQPTINRIRNGKSWPMRETARKLLAVRVRR